MKSVTQNIILQSNDRHGITLIKTAIHNLTEKAVPTFMQGMVSKQIDLVMVRHGDASAAAL